MEEPAMTVCPVHHRGHAEPMWRDAAILLDIAWTIHEYY